VVLKVVLLLVPDHLLDKSEKILVIVVYELSNVLRRYCRLNCLSEPEVRELKRKSCETECSGLSDCGLVQGVHSHKQANQEELGVQSQLLELLQLLIQFCLLPHTTVQD